MAYQQSRNKFKLLMLCSWASAVRYQTNSLKSLQIVTAETYTLEPHGHNGQG